VNDVSKMAVVDKLRAFYLHFENELEQVHDEDLAAELQKIEADVEVLLSSLKRILDAAHRKEDV